jgi:hypothetical protein
MKQSYELFYSSGGHGGPYQSISAAVPTASEFCAECPVRPCSGSTLSSAILFRWVASGVPSSVLPEQKCGVIDDSRQVHGVLHRSLVVLNG